MSDLTYKHIVDELQQLRARAELEYEGDDPCDTSPTGKHLPDFRLGENDIEIVTVCMYCRKKLSGYPR